MEKGELLYNGIRLPEEWPPRHPEAFFEKRENPAPPYLNKKPEIITMGRGRELFVDDFLIRSSTCKRKFHYPEKYEGNPQSVRKIRRIRPKVYEKYERTALNWYCKKVSPRGTCQQPNKNASF